MNDLAVDRDIAAPAAHPARHFDAPHWLTEWVGQVLAASPAPANPRVSARELRPLPAAAPVAPDATLAAARAMREAARVLREAEARGEGDFALAIARHHWHLALRAWRSRVEEAAGPGAFWCHCDLEPGTPH